MPTYGKINCIPHTIFRISRRNKITTQCSVSSPKTFFASSINQHQVEISSLPMIHNFSCQNIMQTPSGGYCEATSEKFCLLFSLSDKYLISSDPIASRKLSSTSFALLCSSLQHEIEN
ncbi:CLUMA_CG000476, isoform A [Clunio marinus]|uniref:CLUMA_CG000476, isoform A n=1 Tax=Clunio marinus TaxID=568069 RepID=A0A1J1HF79_9DIPT|nr:CLUMA_CG000476, isoform A [Clunio marinus]